MMIRLPFLYSWFLLFCLPAAVFGSENIRVALADRARTVELSSNAGLFEEGRGSGHGKKKIVISAASLDGGPVRVGSPGGSVQVNGKTYRGRIEVRKQGDRLLVVNELDIEDYLQGVVASEVPHAWQLEALKAQAVAARTYALYQKRNSGRRAYHMLATVASQVYAGRDGERPRAGRAVRETKGLVLSYGGELIAAYYHSSCGGHTEDAGELWGIDAPYLRGVDCDCQEISQYGAWERRIGKARMIAAARSMGYPVGEIQGLDIRGITAAGRVREVVLRSAQGRTFVPAESFRAALGNTVIPSIFFELELDGEEAVFSGRGMGHGVGLCQWGAEQMAEKGHSFEEILSHYYPGTSLMRMP